jgi:hypothetical protein
LERILCNYWRKGLRPWQSASSCRNGNSRWIIQCLLRPAADIPSRRLRSG